MLKIAWRNVLRNKRRSILSILIITIGVAVLFIMNGYIKGTFDGLKTSSVNQYGNLQIAKKHFWDNDNQRHLLTRSDIEKIKQILAGRKEVTSYTTSLGVNGIVGTEKISTICAGDGVEPGNTQTQNIMITGGVNLFTGDTDKILLGKGVMQKLGVKENEWVSLMTTTMDGAYNAGSLQVSGSFTVGSSEADNVYVILPVSYAQSLLNTDGIDKFIVHLKSVDSTQATANWLREQFRRNKLDIEVKTWLDLAEFYHQVRGLYQMIFYFMSIVVFFLVLVSILEIMSMAFFERMSEIGTVRAIGTKRKQIFSMLTQEGVILGFIGGLLGVMTGLVTAILVNQLNISYTPPSMSQSVPLFVSLSPINGAFPFIIVVMATVISAFYPAVRASRLNIVEVLRHR
jgi:putative ABC transport system permease protein